MKKIYILFVILFVACMLNADNNHAAAYMKMGTDAKAMGMGGAVTASIDNVNAAYWNPANLTFVKTLEIATTFNDMGLDRNLNYFSIGKNFNFGVLALSLMNSSVEDIAGYDEFDNPTGDFNAGENNIAVSFARSWNKISAGINLKYYLSDIDDDTESALGIDLGVNYCLSQYKLKLALMLRDIYSGEIAGEAVPMQYSFGAAWNPYNYLTVGADLRSEINGEFEFALGAEYWNWIMPVYDADNFFNDTKGGLRLGLNNGNLTAGFGIKIRWVEFNYAYINEDMDELFDDTHQFSLVFRPQDEAKRPEPEPVIVYSEPDTVIAESEITEEEVTIVQVSGMLLDELGDPVSAEIAWKIAEDDRYTEFVLTDMDGYYEVYLEKNTTYEYMIDAQDYFVEKSIIAVGDEDIENLDIMLSKLDFSRFVINFEYDSSVIKEESFQVLDDVASVLMAYSTTKIEIAGHTDDTGDYSYNKLLSLDRALAVRDYLVNNGVNAEQLHAVGYGYDYPLYSNDTDEGRAANRRIEIHILESGAIREGILGCVGFDSGKTKINKYSEACLDMLAEQLIENDAVMVEIGAFTDNTGSDKTNLSISQKRAQAVVDYLISKGVKPENLKAKGYGEDQPVAPNDTPKGREMNRRIEIKILSVDSMKTGILENVFFESGKAALTPDSYPQLNKLASELIAEPDMNIEVCGYTDNVGNDEDNLVLSQKRAQTVVDYLMAAGISQERMIATGYGSANPIADNATFEGRARNRRIEVKIHTAAGSSARKNEPKKIQKPKPPVKPAPDNKQENQKPAEKMQEKMQKPEKVEQKVLKNVFFASGKAEIARESYPSLNEVAAEMMADKSMKIEVCGYTDNVGSDAVNLKISKKRAEAVVEYLIAAGISKDRLNAKGLGEADPIADNATKEGRAKNRRIEIKILNN